MDSRVDAKFRRVYRTLAEMVKPDHTALLVIDMQRDYCGEAQIRRGLDPTPQRRAAAVTKPVGLLRSEQVPKAQRRRSHLPLAFDPLLAPTGLVAGMREHVERPVA